MIYRMCRWLSPVSARHMMKHHALTRWCVGGVHVDAIPFGGGKIFVVEHLFDLE